MIIIIIIIMMIIIIIIIIIIKDSVGEGNLISHLKPQNRTYK